ncbi:MAG: hypothetical protein ABIP93_10175 [Gemmatimonadaceae bacterium]
MHSFAFWTALMPGMLLLGGGAARVRSSRMAREPCALRKALRYDESASRTRRTGTGERTIADVQKHHGVIVARRESPGRVSFAYLTRESTVGTAPPRSMPGSIAQYGWSDGKCAIGRLLRRTNDGGTIADDELQFRFEDFLVNLPPRRGGAGSRWVEVTSRSDSLVQGGTRHIRKVRRMMVTGDARVGGSVARRVRVVTTDSIERRQHAGTTLVRVVIVAHGEGSTLVRVADNTMLERVHSQTERYTIITSDSHAPAASPISVQREWVVRLVPDS